MIVEDVWIEVASTSQIRDISSASSIHAKWLFVKKKHLNIFLILSLVEEKTLKEEPIFVSFHIVSLSSLSFLFSVRERE